MQESVLPSASPAPPAASVPQLRSPAARLAPAAESRWGLRDLLTFAAVAAQLALIVLVLREFRLESDSFRWILRLVVPGFVIHHFLPARFRLPFFALLSVTATVMVIGIGPGVTLI